MLFVYYCKYACIRHNAHRAPAGLWPASPSCPWSFCSCPPCPSQARSFSSQCPPTPSQPRPNFPCRYWEVRGCLSADLEALRHWFLCEDSQPWKIMIIYLTIIYFDNSLLVRSNFELKRPNNMETSQNYIFMLEFQINTKHHTYVAWCILYLFILYQRQSMDQSNYNLLWTLLTLQMMSLYPLSYAGFKPHDYGDLSTTCWASSWILFIAKVAQETHTYVYFTLSNKQKTH